RHNGLKQIAERVALLTQTLAETLDPLGFKNENQYYFDTIKIKADAITIRPIAENAQINFCYFEDGTIGISLDETTTQKDVLDIAYVFASLKDLADVAVGFDTEDY